MPESTAVPQKPPSKLQIWWLAIRPRTLPASMAGVTAGVAVAMFEHHVRIPQTLAALLIALLLQIGSNLANDVFDHERGADAARAYGPTRVTESGLLKPAEVKTGMLVVFALAALIGLFLAATVHWLLIPLGALAILTAVAYTGGPYPLGYHGLGELFVLLFFGFTSVAGTAFINLSRVPPAAWAMSVPLGFLIVGILVVNNLRDIDADRLAGKNTLAVHFGEGFARGEYIACMVISFLVVPLYCVAGIIPWWSMLTWLALPMAIRNINIMLTRKGKPLNAALAGTGQLALVYALLFFASALLVSFFS
jgi:1,4-dihydroxy-2-naphthoate octaprenyltransferase